PIPNPYSLIPNLPSSRRCRWSTPRVDRGYRQLRAARQIQLVAPLDDDGPGATAGADRRTNGGAFAAPADRANDRAQGCTDRPPLGGLFSLAVATLDGAVLRHSN